MENDNFINSTSFAADAALKIAKQLRDCCNSSATVATDLRLFHNDFPVAKATLPVLREKRLFSKKQTAFIPRRNLRETKAETSVVPLSFSAPTNERRALVGRSMTPLPCNGGIPFAPTCRNRSHGVWTTARGRADRSSATPRTNRRLSERFFPSNSPSSHL